MATRGTRRSGAAGLSPTRASVISPTEADMIADRPASAAEVLATSNSRRSSTTDWATDVAVKLYAAKAVMAPRAASQDLGLSAWRWPPLSPANVMAAAKEPTAQARAL